MRDFLRNITKTLNSRTGRSGHIFGARYYACLIREPLYYAHALKYVYRNPVKAGLCMLVEDWASSTIFGLTGNSHLPVKIVRPANEIDYLIPEGYEPLLQWLNLPHRTEEAHAIQRALQRKEFKIPVNRKTRTSEKLTALDAP